MARGDASFCRVNCDWSEDPRCQKLSHLEYRLNSYLWMECVKQRKVTLPSHFDLEYWSRRCATTLKTISIGISNMEKLGLLKVNDDNSITLYGVENNNSKIHWKDVEDSTDNQPIRVAKERESKKEKEKESKSVPDPEKTKLEKELKKDAKEIADIYANLVHPDFNPAHVKKVVSLLRAGKPKQDLIDAVQNYAFSQSDQEVKFRKRLKTFFDTADATWSRYVDGSKLPKQDTKLKQLGGHAGSMEAAVKDKYHGLK